MKGTELVTVVLNIGLSILWILIFLQNKRKGTLNFMHLFLLVFALGLLPYSLFQVLNSW